MVKPTHKFWRWAVIILYCCALIFTGPAVAFASPTETTQEIPYTEAELNQAPDSAQVPLSSYNGAPTPDWSQLTLNDLPAFTEAGRIDIPPEFESELGPSRSWNAGDSPASILRLGDLSDTNVGNFTLQQYLDFGGLNADEVALSNLGPMEWQTLDDLAIAVPGLSDTTVSESPAIAEYLSVAQYGNVFHSDTILEEFGGTQIGELTRRGEQAYLTDTTFGQIDLEQWSMNDIAGLSDTQTGNLKGWQQSYANEIPGLTAAPMDQVVGSVKGSLGFVAIFDVPYGAKEHTTTPTRYSITGSNQEGFHVQCAQETGCAHIELAAPFDLGPLSDLGLHGAQWIKGGESDGGQMVRGGEGVLGAVNGGREPTGRHPFGDAFKLVLIDVDEPSGTGTFGIYTRYCQRYPIDLGCTPYFIGPIPLFTVNEKSLVIVGLTPIGASQLGDVPLSPEQAEMVRRLMEQDSSGRGGGRGGGFNFSSECVERAAGAVPTANQSEESDRIVSAIMREAQEQGITDPAQLAYMLATAETETDFRIRSEDSGGSSAYGGGTRYRGRGIVQLTHQENYQKMSERTGVDLVNNPERANELDIAAFVTVNGMRDGVFTGRSLDDYINSETGQMDFEGARTIINDWDKAAETAAAAQRYYAAMEGCSNEPTSAGAANGDLMAAVESNYGMVTSDCPGTNGGRRACACAVNRVLINAGYEPLGPGAEGSYSVSEVHRALEDGRGTEVQASDAQAGDIVIVYRSENTRHIGFCLNDGCTRARSNSSSNGSFSWDSDGYFSPSYGPNSRRHIFRMNN